MKEENSLLLQKPFCSSPHISQQQQQKQLQTFMATLIVQTVKRKKNQFSLFSVADMMIW